MAETPEEGCEIISRGESAREAIDNWKRMAKLDRAEYDYIYDLPSMLNFYAGRITYTGLSRISGISAAQIAQYAYGYRNASSKTTRRVQEALRQFAEPLARIRIE